MHDTDFGITLCFFDFSFPASLTPPEIVNKQHLQIGRGVENGFGAKLSLVCLSDRNS